MRSQVLLRAAQVPLGEGLSHVGFGLEDSGFKVREFMPMVMYHFTDHGELVV